MAARKKTGGGKRKAKAGAERPIEQYEHKGKQRANNPPVGLVTPESDRDGARKVWAYDPHLDPHSGRARPSTPASKCRPSRCTCTNGLWLRQIEICRGGPLRWRCNRRRSGESLGRRD